MADDKSTTTSTTTTTPPAATDGDLGDNGKKAIKAERDARRKAEQEAADLKQRLQAIEDKDKSDSQKATDRATAAEQERDALKAQLLRSQIARKHGLADDDMEFVSGSTEEEIETSAQKLAGRILKNATGTEDTGGDGKDTGDGKDAGGGAGGAPAGRPTQNLSGGGNPTQQPEETDPAKLAAGIPRF